MTEKTSKGISVDAASRTTEAPEEDHMLESAVTDLVPKSCGALIMGGFLVSMTCFPSVCVS